jgi:hypothetical protein
MPRAAFQGSSDYLQTSEQPDWALVTRFRTRLHIDCALVRLEARRPELAGIPNLLTGGVQGGVRTASDERPLTH